jgi:hypothetical protein
MWLDTYMNNTATTDTCKWCSRPATTHVEHPERGEAWTMDVCNRHAVAYKRMERNGYGYVVVAPAREVAS